MFLTFARSICWRKSGPVSITKVFPFISIKTEVRKRLSLESVDWQTLQGHAIIGIPCEVPVPKNVICTVRIVYFKINTKIESLS
jgi:hypothetical protein